MISLEEYIIQEKLKVTKKSAKINHIPKDYDELFVLIHDRYPECNGHLDCTDIDVSEIDNMHDLFSSLNKLQSIDITGWDTSNVTNMQHMFSYLPNLEKIVGLKDIDVSSVDNMASMFENCRLLEQIDIRSWDMSKVKNMSHMFEFCFALKDIPGIEDIDTSSNTECEGTFRGCYVLTKLDLHKWKVDNVITFTEMFDACKSLEYIDLSGWDIKATDADAMFMNCQDLTHLDLTGWTADTFFNCSKMFRGCSKLETIIGDIENWDMHGIEIAYMFENASKLKLDLSNWNIRKNTKKEYVFSGAPLIKKP